MFLDRFALRLTARVVMVLLSALLAAAAFWDGRFVVSGTMVVALVAAQLYWLIMDVRRTNLELARFLETARAGDFSQRFDTTQEGAGFDELGKSLSGLMERFREERADTETELRYLRAIMDQVPVPLVSVLDDGSLERLNNAARRMLGTFDVRRVEQLEPLGAELMAVVRDAEPGQRHVVHFGERDRVVVSLSRISAAGQSLRLFSLQSLRDELEGAELEAWQQLVRVLTHELMNSLTPIRSLARTSAELLNDEDAGDEAVADAREAVETVAKRAEGLLSFVESYRQISRMPKPDKEVIAVRALFARIASLFSSELPDATLECQVDPANLELHADPRQIEQILINLIRNAREAAEGPVAIRLEARIDREGRAELAVADDGPGLAPDVAKRAFIPFYTTKRGGTGVGLALTRQIMRAHGGFVSLDTAPGKGARFVLTF